MNVQNLSVFWGEPPLVGQGSEMGQFQSTVKKTKGLDVAVFARALELRPDAPNRNLGYTLLQMGIAQLESAGYGNVDEGGGQPRASKKEAQAAAEASFRRSLDVQPLENHHALSNLGVIANEVLLASGVCGSMSGVCCCCWVECSWGACCC
jgi:hypothetical protein